MIPAHIPQYGDELSAASADEEVLQRFVFRRTRGVLFRWTDETRKICVNVDQEEAKERQRGRKERGGRRRDMVAPQGGLPNGWTTSAQYAAMTGAGKKSLQRTPPLSLSPPPPSMSGGIEPGTSLSLAGMNLNASSSTSSAQPSRSGSPLPPDFNFLDDGSSRPSSTPSQSQSRHNFQQQQQQHSIYPPAAQGSATTLDTTSLYDSKPAPGVAPLQHSWSEPSNSGGDSNIGHHQLQQHQSVAYAQLQARMLAQQQQLYQKQQEELEEQQRLQREQLQERQKLQQQEFLLQQQRLMQSYAPPTVSGPTPILPQAPARGDEAQSISSQSQSQPPSLSKSASGQDGGSGDTWGGGGVSPPVPTRNMSNPGYPLWSAGGEGLTGTGDGNEGSKTSTSDLGDL
ncbi:hypothetical protein TrVE_jg7029 [Triparma verrucosa]|uniref:Uncharacterized protein n=1 Tax=Triparma verrucosa TaxID=1606542 RepID=A0A9W7C701_9STRA|nr:hypothetical protein TrVE_jg7029 [Triparma verrucosa]